MLSDMINLLWTDKQINANRSVSTLIWSWGFLFVSANIILQQLTDKTVSKEKDTHNRVVKGVLEIGFSTEFKS